MTTVLVIDDDSTIQLVVKKVLQKQGYEVILASNGQEGIDLAEQLQPDLIICDWMMPLLDGLEVCRRVKAHPVLSTTFFILLTSRDDVADRVRGLDTGADDFLAKPIELAELQARVRAGLRLHQLTRDLQTQKQLLEAELAEAAAYVQSLLPPPVSEPIAIDARFIPSRQLGGDCFDYFWLDPDYLALYLLDVSGHGLGAALPSSWLLNLLRSRALPEVNFYQPHDVLEALNETFQMNHQNQKYFTLWYGVYNCAKRQLTYASAGHPPAVLLTPTATGPLRAMELRTPCPPIGLLPEATYSSERITVPASSTLYVFSDGAYELNQGQADEWSLEEFIQFLVSFRHPPSLDEILTHLKQVNLSESFQDDLSLLRVEFEASQPPGQ